MSSQDALIVQALEKARYNESVIVCLNNPDPGKDTTPPRELLFLASLDTQNGGIQWNPTEVSSHNTRFMIQRHFQTKKWILPMLNDHHRNHLYQQAISDAIDTCLKKKEDSSCANNKKIQVLDIGSGTGLLAMMSCEKFSSDNILLKGGQDKHNFFVQCLEMSNAMVHLSRQLLASHPNPLCQSHVNVQQAHSMEFQASHEENDEEQQPKSSSLFQICTCELLESGVLAEGWIPTMRDAWKRLLAPDAVVVPQRARIMAQLVDGSLCRQYSGPEPFTAPSSSSSSSAAAAATIQFSTSGEASDTLLSGGFHVPLHLEKLLQSQQNIPLSDRVHVMTIDVSSPDKIPDSTGSKSVTSVPVTRKGTVQGIVFWWELDIGTEGVTYSTQAINPPAVNDNTCMSGEEPHWQDHWHQCLYILPSNASSITVDESESVQLCALHDDYQVHFSVSQSTKTKEILSLNKRPRLEKEESQETSTAAEEIQSIIASHPRLISPLRALQLNNVSRTALLHRAISFAMSSIKNVRMLDLSDFSLCAILSARIAMDQAQASSETPLAVMISSVESPSTGSSDLAMTAARVAQLGNSITPKTETALKHFEILACHVEQLSVAHLGASSTDGSPSPANIVVSEPYYERLEGWSIAEALNYFYLLRGLKQRAVVDSSAISIPSFARIMACPIECMSLESAYTTTSWSAATILGNDSYSHRGISDAVETSLLELSLPIIQQYSYRQLLNEAVEVATIDYTEMTLKHFGEWSMPVQLDCPGTVHALMFWVDYGIPVDDGEFDMLSTKGSDCHQTVKLMSEAYSMHDSSLSFRLSTKETIESQSDYELEARFEHHESGNS